MVRLHPNQLEQIPRLFRIFPGTRGASHIDYKNSTLMTLRIRINKNLYRFEKHPESEKAVSVS